MNEINLISVLVPEADMTLALAFARRLFSDKGAEIRAKMFTLLEEVASVPALIPEVVTQERPRTVKSAIKLFCGGKSLTSEGVVNTLHKRGYLANAHTIRATLSLMIKSGDAQYFPSSGPLANLAAHKTPKIYSIKPR